MQWPCTHPYIYPTLLPSTLPCAAWISLSMKEFQEGQDDMAFVTSPDTEKITIANDVITLPDYTSAKSRLSVRYVTHCTVCSVYVLIWYWRFDFLCWTAPDVLILFSCFPSTSPTSGITCFFLNNFHICYKSFAIAQSAVLAIFEARIERKTEEYR